MLGLLGLRIFEATAANITDLGEEHGHRVLRVTGKGTKVVLVPLPPAVGRAIDQAVAGRTAGPILRNVRGRRMDRHAATRRLQHLATATGFAMPHLLSRPGFHGGSQSTEDESHGCTEEVPRGASGAGDADGGGGPS